MKGEIHKYLNNYVIFRFDEERETLTRDKRSEYWTGENWKSGYKYAKLFPSHSEALKEFLLIGFKSPNNEERDTESD